jgi:hypothetical protein
MALETLKDVAEIGGFKVVDMNKIKETSPEMFRPDGSMIYHIFDEKIRPFNFIYVRHDVNSIAFNLQNGPVKEKGVNGCQVNTVIEAAKVILEGLNKQFPCRENSVAITKLDEAIMWLDKRTKDREKRGVEGLNKA